MVFSSIEFLFRFLPIFLILYHIAKPNYRNIVLLLGSLFFYGYGEPKYVLLMVLSIVVNHFLAFQIGRFREMQEQTGDDFTKERKRLLVGALVFDFGILFVFKYLNFVIDNINVISGHNLLQEVSLTLPLGISFYTFQIVSYVVDVYRGKYRPSRNIISFATYVAMFPQLIAGPIVNYQEVRKHLNRRKTDFRGIEWGMTIFVMGLSYKVLLANKIASLWNDVQTIGVLGIDVPTAWLASWGYSMQLFFDFFGYSLMAIGLGRMLGFNFPLNFKDPYISTSATEFWRRWHITLSRWFRAYVYIPLGGNRKGEGRRVFNLFVVWMLTGLWHGANWNFVLWGMFYFVLLTIEKLFLLKIFDKLKFVGKLLGHIYMLIVIPVSWTIFNITDLKDLWLYLQRMFGIAIPDSVVQHGSDKFLELLSTYGWLLAICVLCATPLPMRIVKKCYRNWLCKVVFLVLFWFSVYQIVMGANNPFLYFRF